MPRDRDDHNDLHSQIFDLFLSKVRDDAYPSTTHLDMIEEMLRDEDEVDEYSSALMDKVRLDTYPSIDHLRRLMNFA